jgi:hypothetical protein
MELEESGGARLAASLEELVPQRELDWLTSGGGPKDDRL